MSNLKEKLLAALRAGIKTVYLVTSGWHMRRALIAFRKALQVLCSQTRLR